MSFEYFFYYLKDSYKEYLDAIVSQLSGDRPPVENSEFSAVGARGWRYSLRDYSNSVPVCLSVDLDAALAEIDAVEFDASRIVTNFRFLGPFLTFSAFVKSFLSSTEQYYPRRKYIVLGSCCFYRGLLVASHASKEEQKLISMVHTVVPLQHNEICESI